MDGAGAVNNKPESLAQNSIEEEAVNFPAYMQMIPSLFEFAFHEAKEVISKSVGSNADLLDLLQDASDRIQNSEIDPTLKAEVLSLIEGEIEVFTYSQRARCSVISM